MKRFVLTLLILIPIAGFSQKSDVGNWFIYFGNQKINNKWNWWNEVQYRNYNFAGDLQQLLLRTGVGYNLTENNNNVLLGYAFIKSQRYIPNSDDKVGTNEHRLYQQFITRQNFGRVFIQHRYRIEERFLADDFKMRFRYFLSLNVPLNKKTMEAKAIYASAYNEIFLNSTNTLFDRNRLYGALGYVFSKNFRMEAGFMNQTLESSYRNQFQIVLFNNLSLQQQK
ncbi:MAG: DUF2490 domain-containing protein [Saprospiraceae bacterium]|uniref:DUF2490 domain-containing protein n=1 Tax=Candidatus Opimibacter skivensis TaxID=2982028 RepID=A0A9D7SQ58_9BACT|nr:DUF2490 domain-containing protein [Candidatus Opimibacter skivensis]